MTNYKVTLVIKANTHPRKWLAESIEQALENDEDILEYEIVEVDE